MAAGQRAEDGLRGGCEAALQHEKGESDAALRVVAGDLVHLHSYVLADRLVQLVLEWRELISDRAGAAFGEQTRPIEMHELLLEQSAHQAGRRRGFDVSAVVSVAQQ